MAVALKEDKYEGTERVAALVANREEVVQRIARLIELWRYKRYYSLDEICKELGTTERTARDDIGRLRKIGLVMGEKIEGVYCYRLSYGGFKVWLKEFRKKVLDPIQKIVAKRRSQSS